MLVYLACIALIGVPILVSEWMIGRRGQKNPINTMAQLARDNGHSTNWAVVGAVGVFAAFLILSFYSVIGGWALATCATLPPAPSPDWTRPRSAAPSRASWRVRASC